MGEFRRIALEIVLRWLEQIWERKYSRDDDLKYFFNGISNNIVY